MSSRTQHQGENRHHCTRFLLGLLVGPETSHSLWNKEEIIMTVMDLHSKLLNVQKVCMGLVFFFNMDRVQAVTNTSNSTCC